jgi:pimeloyl-ACP methyl ester carboxylesterase
MRGHRYGPLVTLVVVSALATGCTPSASPTAASPVSVLSWGTCPPAVEATFLTRHQCGTLTVPIDRSRPASGTTSLLVTRAWPVEESTMLPGVGTGFGHDLGGPEDFGASGATRMRRVFTSVIDRGDALHSTTSLACPEIDSLSARVAAAADGDPAVRSAFVDAVGACARRLRDAGIEPTHFGPADAAADVEDLRRALGIDRWDVAGSYGSRSLVLTTYAATYPDAVRAAYLDSPMWPDEQSATQRAQAATESMARLVQLCTADETCAREHPDLNRIWQQALDRLQQQPLRGSGRSGTSADASDIAVLVDAAKLVRFATAALSGDGPADLAWLPAAIDDAANGILEPHLADKVASDPAYCAGYRPLCEQRPFSHGSFLTGMCQFPGYATQGATAPTGDPLLEVYRNDPWAEACSTWGVPTTSHSTTIPVGMPVLVMSGELDPFSPPRATTARAASLGTPGWPVVVPGQTHNVLGFLQCVIDLRNTWVEHPSAPPDSAGCEGDITFIG